MPMWKYRSYKTRYIGDAYTFGSEKVVHDLDNEQGSCNIDRIIDRDRERSFESLQEAYAAGFTPCSYCMPQEYSKKAPKGKMSIDDLFKD